MFWNQDSKPALGKFLAAIDASDESCVLRFPTDWSMVSEAGPVPDVEAAVGWADHHDGTSFQSVVAQSLRQWRINPGRSALRGIDCLLDGLPGAPMFDTPLSQSLFLESLVQAGVVRNSDLRTLAVDRKRVQLGQGIHSLAATPEALPKIEAFAKALVLWKRNAEARVEAGSVKLPKMLYRGIRFRNIQIEGVRQREGENRWEYEVRIAEERLRMLLANPLRESQAVGTLSFTERQPAAEYFANDEGFVIAVDPRDVEIVTSWSLEEALSGADPTNGRSEREWIVRIPSNYRIRPDQVTIRSSDYAIATGDITRIDGLYHDFRAEYMNDKGVVSAVFCYNSNGMGGAVHYGLNDGFMHCRRTFKAKHGFDPVPASASDVSNVRFWSEDKFLRKRSAIDPLPGTPLQDLLGDLADAPGMSR